VFDALMSSVWQVKRKHRSLVFIHLTNINGCLSCTRHSARSYLGISDESAEILPFSLRMLCCKEYYQSQVIRPLSLQPWNL
jgi:hypothetical protein